MLQQCAGADQQPRPKSTGRTTVHTATHQAVAQHGATRHDTAQTHIAQGINLQQHANQPVLMAWQHNSHHHVAQGIQPAVTSGGMYGCERVCRCAVVVLVADPYAALNADRQRLRSCGCVTPAIHQVSSSSMPHARSSGSLLSDQPGTCNMPAPTTAWFLLAATIKQQLQQPCLHTSTPC